LQRAERPRGRITLGGGGRRSGSIDGRFRINRDLEEVSVDQLTESANVGADFSCPETLTLYFLKHGLP
jgi:hypothetical protein